MIQFEDENEEQLQPLISWMQFHIAEMMQANYMREMEITKRNVFTDKETTNNKRIEQWINNHTPMKTMSCIHPIEKIIRRTGGDYCGMCGYNFPIKY